MKALQMLARQSGKTLAVERAIADYIRRNPEATIFRVGPDGDRIEKFAGSGRIEPLPALPKPSES